MFFEERIAELMRKMLRKKLYVLISKPLVPPEKLKPFLLAHLEYMIGLEKRGVVFASGPAGRRRGAAERAGLDRAAGEQTPKEARAIAEGDPFFVNGLRTFELKEWTIMEGTLGAARQSLRSIDRSGMKSQLHQEKRVEGRSWRPSALSASARSACRSRRI